MKTSYLDLQWIQRSAPQSMVHGIASCEHGALIAKSSIHPAVFERLWMFDVEGFPEVTLFNMKFIRRDPHDRTCLLMSAIPCASKVND
jgi:hypothetical protein